MIKRYGVRAFAERSTEEEVVLENLGHKNQWVTGYWPQEGFIALDIGGSYVRLEESAKHYNLEVVCNAAKSLKLTKAAFWIYPRNP